MDKKQLVNKVSLFLDCPVVSIKEVKGGRNKVLELTTENRKTWFLKEFNQQEFVHEQSVACLVNNKNIAINVPQAFLFNAGESQYALLSDVPKCAAIQNSDPLQLSALTQSLIGIHTLMPWPELKKLHLPDTKPLLLKHLDISDSHIGRVLNQMPNESGGVKGVLHGDLSTGNVYWSTPKKLGLIDWEFACYGDVHWDLATYTIEHSLSLNEYFLLLNNYARQTMIDAEQFQSGAELWLLYYWLVAVDWANINNYDVSRYQEFKSTIDQIIHRLL